MTLPSALGRGRLPMQRALPANEQARNRTVSTSSRKVHCPRFEMFCKRSQLSNTCQAFPRYGHYEDGRRYRKRQLARCQQIFYPAFSQDLRHNTQASEQPQKPLDAGILLLLQAIVSLSYHTSSRTFSRFRLTVQLLITDSGHNCHFQRLL